jgi:hypothetical protein
MAIAHLKTQATNGNPLSRLQWKLTVAKSLYQRGYSRQDILELFRLINWMMTKETGFFNRCLWRNRLAG